MSFDADCPHISDHPVLDQRVTELERRVTSLESTQNDKWDKLNQSFADLRASVANLSGRVTGYLLAAGLLGAVVAIIAQIAITHISTDRVTSPQDVPALVVPRR